MGYHPLVHVCRSMCTCAYIQRITGAGTRSAGYHGQGKSQLAHGFIGRSKQRFTENKESHSTGAQVLPFIMSWEKMNMQIIVHSTAIEPGTAADLGTKQCVTWARLACLLRCCSAGRSVSGSGEYHKGKMKDKTQPKCPSKGERANNGSPVVPLYLWFHIPMSVSCCQWSLK